MNTAPRQPSTGSTVTDTVGSGTSTPQAGDDGGDRELRPIRNLDDLRSVLGGRLSRPSDADWDQARAAWQLLVDQQPAAVVHAASRHDLAVTVRAAGALGLRVAPQTTGHNAAPLGDLSDTILLRTGSLDGVEIDAAAQTARIEAGVSWGDLTTAAAPYGLATIGGFAAGVGAIGSLLGGGLGWFARSRGLGSSWVLELEAVTPDGVVRRVAPGDPLFDLLLDGADIAVIAGATLQLHPIDTVFAGALFWPAESAGEIFRAWTAWTAEVPETVTSLVRVLRIPDMPGVPEVFAGRSFAVVEAAMELAQEQADAVLAPLRNLNPQIDTFAITPVPALAALHMDPPDPMPSLSCSALLAELPEDAVDALVDAATRGPGAMLTSVELRQLGGALDRGRRNAVAGCRALLYAVAITPVPEAVAAAQAACAAVSEAVRSVRSPMEVRTFTETRIAPERLFDDDSALAAAKREWDPGDLVHAAHSVLPHQEELLVS